MGRLLAQAFSLRHLELAWHGILENDKDDGQLSRGVARFARDPPVGLALLEAELADGSYEPHDLTEVVIAEDDGSERHLHIPTVRDRIVERSILDVVTPYVDPCLGSTSFAYRAGLGVTDVVQALVALREEGLTWVLRTDVHDCFPSVPRYPPLLEDHRVVVPARRVMYTSLQGGRVRTQAGRLIVESAQDAKLLDLPTAHVSRIVCFGSVGVSAGVRTWALDHDVDVVFASRRGSYQGQLLSASSAARAARLRAQMSFVDQPDHAIPLAVAIVEAKVRKQIVLLQRFGRRGQAEQVRDAVAQMRQVLLLLDQCATRAEVMGVEGAAARAYFPCFGGLFPQGLRFETRSRQPPRDVANSALSFLYTVLLGECVSALYAAGLDPSFGVLHAEQERRPSLGLDLMEEFRPLIVDQVVLAAARSGELRVEHARQEPGRAGVLLTKAGRGAILEGYERRMLRTTRGALPGFNGSLRRHLYRQAQRLVAVISDPAASWTGLLWR